MAGLLASIPPVQYVAAGSCGVKYVSKGLEIVCCRAGKAEFTTLAGQSPGRNPGMLY